jgi:hypothetical protein
MGWFDSVINIGATIGNVCGALQGGSQLAVHFGAKGAINTNLGGVVFFNDPALSGQVSVLNQNADASTISISIPGNPLTDNGPTEITLPYSSKIGMGPAFYAAANGGNDEIRINLNPPTSSAADGDSTSNINVNASSTAVLNPGATIQVGGYFSATLNDRTITITAVSTVVLVGVVLLNVRGASGNLVRIIRAINGTSEDTVAPTGIDLEIPAGIDLDDGITYTELTCTVTQSSMLLASAAPILPLDDADIALLRRLKSAK